MNNKKSRKVTTKKRPPLTPKEAFLSALSKAANVSLACEESGISRQTVYRWKIEDEEFAKHWNQALEDGIDMLEGIALKRARKSSDTLMIFLLKAHLPQKYRERFEQDIKNLPEVKAMGKSFGQLLKEYVPREHIESALNRFRQLTGLESSAGGNGDGQAATPGHEI